MKLISLLTLGLAINISANSSMVERCVNQIGEEVRNFEARMELVEGRCFVKNFVAGKYYSDFKNVTKKFLAAEKELTGIYDVHGVNDIVIYRKDVYSHFSPRNIDSAELMAVTDLARRGLGIYDENQDLLDIFRSAKKLKHTEVRAELEDLFISDERIANEDDYVDQDELDALKEEIKMRAKYKEAALDNLTELLVGGFGANADITVYELQDNNNENVQDAQYLFIGEGHAIAINKFWWL